MTYDSLISTMRLRAVGSSAQGDIRRRPGLACRAPAGDRRFRTYASDRVVRRSAGDNDRQTATTVVDVEAETAGQANPASAWPRAGEGTTAAPRSGGVQKRRTLFFPTPASLCYLDGSLPGDQGFDPLRLADPVRNAGDGSGKMNLGWLSYAEVIHGRWAMLGAAGMLAPEALARAGVTPAATGLPWFEAGGLFNDASGFMTGIPFFGDIPFAYWTDQYSLLYSMLVLMAFAELKRGQDYKYPGSQGRQYFLGLEAALGGSGDPKYPGGQFFNLFNLGGGGGEALARLKTAEVKHGRLAMVAAAGLAAQAAATRVGPLQNLLDHVADPAHRNVAAFVGAFTSDAAAPERLPFVLWALAGAAVWAFAAYADSAPAAAAAGNAPAQDKAATATTTAQGDEPTPGDEPAAE